MDKHWGAVKICRYKGTRKGCPSYAQNRKMVVSGRRRPQIKKLHKIKVVKHATVIQVGEKQSWYVP